MKEDNPLWVMLSYHQVDGLPATKGVQVVAAAIISASAAVFDGWLSLSHGWMDVSSSGNGIPLGNSLAERSMHSHCEEPYLF
jgi:hypothetical protein